MTSTHKALILCLVGGVLSVGCGPVHLVTIPPRAILSAVEESVYRIGPEDVLAVSMDDADLPIDVVVRSDGYISLPRLHDVKAGDLTPMELQAALEIAAKSSTIAVMVKQTNSRKVYVIGTVRSPGVYALVGPTTVLQLLARAGGFGEWAKTTRVLVWRDAGGEWLTPYEFNYRRLEHKGAGRHDFALRPGDVVVVP